MALSRSHELLRRSVGLMGFNSTEGFTVDVIDNDDAFTLSLLCPMDRVHFLSLEYTPYQYGRKRDSFEIKIKFD